MSKLWTGQHLLCVHSTHQRHQCSPVLNAFDIVLKNSWNFNNSGPTIFVSSTWSLTLSNYTRSQSLWRLEVAAQFVLLSLFYSKLFSYIEIGCLTHRWSWNPLQESLNARRQTIITARPCMIQPAQSTGIMSTIYCGIARLKAPKNFLLHDIYDKNIVCV